MKENNIDQLFSEGLNEFERNPKKESFNQIREKFLKEKLAAKVPTWSPFAYSSLALLFLIGSVFLLSNNVEINSETAMDKASSESSKESTATISNNYSSEKNMDVVAGVKSDLTLPNHEIPVNSETLIAKKIKSRGSIVKADQAIVEYELNNFNTNAQKEPTEKPLLNSNTIKIKNTGKELGLNFLRFHKQSDRLYILEGLKDSIKIISEPKNGKVYYDESTGKFNYLANNGFSGIDSFSYILYSNAGTEISRGTIKVEVEKDTSSINSDYGSDSSFALKNDSNKIMEGLVISPEKKSRSQRS